jgi:hypothetical protein
MAPNIKTVFIKVYSRILIVGAQEVVPMLNTAAANLTTRAREMRPENRKNNCGIKTEPPHRTGLPWQP